MSTAKRCALRATLVGSLLACWNVLAVPVVPGGFADTEGESNNVIPFTNQFGRGYQQIYDAAGFGGLSGALNSIAFRLDAFQPEGYSITGQVNLSVKLATTARTSQTVSSVFAENRGADALEVFNGNVNFALADLPGFGANPFDFSIDFDRPFFFDGMQNLLLELTLLQPLVSSDPFGIVLDAASGPFGRAFTTSTGNFTTPGFGLITQFDITPAVVSEPGAMALFLLGLVSAFGFGTRKSSRRRSLRCSGT